MSTGTLKIWPPNVARSARTLFVSMPARRIMSQAMAEFEDTMGTPVAFSAAAMTSTVRVCVHET